MDILNNLERVGTVQLRYQKHYENDTDELKRYGFFKKSKANVVKLNTLNPEPVSGITSMMDFSQAVYDRLRPRLKHTAKPLGIFLPYVNTYGPHGTCVDGVSSDSCYCDPEFQETERRQNNLPYMLKVNEFASLMRQSSRLHVRMCKKSGWLHGEVDSTNKVGIHRGTCWNGYVVSPTRRAVSHRTS